MTLTLWLSLVAACLVISLTPGAGAVNTMTASLKHGWKKAFFTIMGQQLALVVQIAIVAAGLGVVVANSPLLFDLIRYGGAAYLIYLGLRMILARPHTAQQAHDEAESSGGASGRRPGAPLALFNQGFWVNMSNPKALVFILAFIPQFVRPDAPQLPQYLLLACTMVAIDIVVMWGGFALVAKTLTRLSRSERGQTILNRVFGSLFILVAALMVFAGR